VRRPVHATPFCSICTREETWWIGEPYIWLRQTQKLQRDPDQKARPQTEAGILQAQADAQRHFARNAAGAGAIRPRSLEVAGPHGPSVR
jgi:hypothetical protein